MCGIVGYVGALNAKCVLLNGLSLLEYRGYDSAGIAVLGDGAVDIRKTVNKVASLELDCANLRDGCVGIGHTRWATHGAVTEQNAHPHRAGRVTLVHNGIIENHRALREALERQGRVPLSETDTEIAAMVIDECYTVDPRAAIQAAIARFEGAYAFAIMFDDVPGKLFAIRNQNPLAVMHVKGESYLASDVSALLSYGRSYVTPEDGVLCELSAEGVRYFDAKKEVYPTEKMADWDVTSIDKGPYPHYMLKEIEEQPCALRRTIARYTNQAQVDFSIDGVPDALFTGVKQVYMLGCGTAMHAGLTAKPYFEEIAGVCAEVGIASEFGERDARIHRDALFILISQSGETADTLSALRTIRAVGARHLAIVNAKGTAMSRESANVVYTQAGPEISVASTKAFTTQVAMLYLVALKLAEQRGMADMQNRLHALKHIETQVEAVISRRKEIQRAVKYLLDARSAFYLGRGMDMALAQEGALKIKEISYIHAEAYAAGEMKHGIISLIEPGVPTVVLDTQPEYHEKAQLCAREIRARGGEVVFITMKDWNVEPECADCVLRLHGEGGAMTAFALATCLQLMAYECARLRGLPIDQPRNLAKSVTVA